jgi:collagenase-like PrtC family protease
MANFIFSVPCGDDLSTMDEMVKLAKVSKNRIKEVYLSGPQIYSGAGRLMKNIGMKDHVEVVDKIHEKGIAINLVLNSVCEGMEWYSPDNIAKLINYLETIHIEHGIEAVTIANPVFISIIRKRFPKLEICASVLSDIDCVQRALIFRNAGADIITPDASINRDLELLKKIKKATGTELKLMLNEGCLYKCPYRKFHFNAISHASKELPLKKELFIADFFNFCSKVIDDNSSQILKSPWIRPEDVKKYSDITTTFKIVGRDLPRDRAIRTIKAYLYEDYSGDLMDILCSSLLNYSLSRGVSVDNKVFDECMFFEKVTSCDRDCLQCKYCDDLAKIVIKSNNYTPHKLGDLVIPSLGIKK